MTPEQWYDKILSGIYTERGTMTISDYATKMIREIIAEEREACAVLAERAVHYKETSIRSRKEAPATIIARLIRKRSEEI